MEQELEQNSKQLTKEELIQMVSQWIEMDTEINKLNKTITEIKKQIQVKNKNKKK